MEEQPGRSASCVSVRYAFERPAAAFDRAHKHATVEVSRTSDIAFTVEATAGEQSKNLARVSVEAPNSWQNPALLYERGDRHFGSAPYYRVEVRVGVKDEENALGFEPLARHAWTYEDRIDSPQDVAKAFWERFNEGWS